MQTDEASGMVQQFQSLQQQYQAVVFQKETTAMQIQETKSALEELASAKSDVFRAVGAILVKKDAAALKTELLEQKDIFEARLKSLEKQETLISEKLAELQGRFVRQTAGHRGAGAGAK